MTMILTFMGHLQPSRRCSANFQGVIVVLPFKERAVTEAVTSNLQGTKWQHRDSNPDPPTPPEPVVLTLFLCVHASFQSLLDKVTLVLCVLIIPHRDREQARDFQVRGCSTELLPWSGVC